MTLEQTIRSIINPSSAGRTGNHERDTGLILCYYGFDDEPCPTMDEVGEKYEIGTSSGRKAERVRQIINHKLKLRTDQLNLPAFEQLKRVLHSLKNTVSRERAVFDLLLENKLITQPKSKKSIPSIYGLRRLLNHLALNDGYDLYDTELNKLTREQVQQGHEGWLIHSSIYKALNKSTNLLTRLPGRYGVCDLGAIKKSDLPKSPYFKEALEMVICRDNCWVDQREKPLCFTLVDRENRLLNQLSKIASVHRGVPIGPLVDTLIDSFKQRSLPMGRPTKKSLNSFFMSAPILHYNPETKMVRLNVEPGGLTDIDEHTITFLKRKENRFSPYVPLRDYLLEQGYSAHHITQHIRFSPLIFIDRAGGRMHHIYSLVGS